MQGLRGRLMCNRSFRFYRSTFSSYRRVSETRCRARFLHNGESASKEEMKEGMVYIDNLYPLRFNMFDVRQILFRPSTDQILNRAKREIVPIMPFGFKIKDAIPRLKDGGAFLRFEFRTTEGESPQKLLDEIQNRIQTHLKDKKIISWFNLQRVRAFVVRGEPFMEDMVLHYASPKVKVEFQGATNFPSMEALYKTFRQFGRIFDIQLISPSAKELPKYAIVQFTRVRNATSARNCLHGMRVEDARLSIFYERQMRTNVIKQWITSHPRIAIPLIAGSLGLITWAVFDPIRIFCITSKITRRFNPDEYALYRWLRRETWARLTSPAPSGEDVTGWSDRAESNEQLINWLNEYPETFIIVTGPKGSGKSALVRKAIEKKKHKLIINCDNLVSSRSMNATAAELAKQVGYFPVFTFLTSASGMLDAIVTATTGQKTGLSASSESLIKQILETTALALHDITPTKHSVEAQGEKKRKQSLSTEEELKLDLDDIPVVVIDGFLLREKSGFKEMWDSLAEWAAVLVENHVAHVVFVSNNVQANKTISRALPNKTFNIVTLSDASTETALEYVRKHLDQHEDTPELVESVRMLGGRLTDLDLLVQRVRGGWSLREAAADIVTKAVTEIRKHAFGEDAEDVEKIMWNEVQIWQVIKALAENGVASYEELKWSGFFKGDDRPFEAMERSELISISHYNGRPQSIRPGKPVYLAAFRDIVADRSFSAEMEQQSLSYLISQETQKINQLEEELRGLASLFSTSTGGWLFGGGSKAPRELEGRVAYLLNMIQTSHGKVLEWEKQLGEVKKVLEEEAKKVTNGQD
ncbi:uncharacterized protein VTP21DRAFT_4630 [Calcarisporiella thermophila]|uniref:uncharacterized protein n=1 Tax=Calcarisporiella thermophila TaxID=911321 RepID=UPI003742B721